jgi:hypothetical protein
MEIILGVLLVLNIICFGFNIGLIISDNGTALTPFLCILNALAAFLCFASLTTY